MEIDLITALNSAFEKDPTHSNFTITLGIDIYCEDNVQSADDDIFDSLIIKSVSLSFNCTKKIDHSTTLSWNQVSDKLDNQVSEITEARFNFKGSIFDFTKWIAGRWNRSNPNNLIRKSDVGFNTALNLQYGLTYHEIGVQVIT